MSRRQFAYLIIIGSNDFFTFPLFNFSTVARNDSRSIYELFVEQLRQFLAVFTFNFSPKKIKKTKRKAGGKQKVNQHTHIYKTFRAWENGKVNSTEGESSGNSNGNFSRQKLKKLQLHCDNFFSSCVSSIRYMFIFIFYLVYSWLILEYSNSVGEGGGVQWGAVNHASY